MKRIIYLDQNYLINLTKARLDVPSVVPEWKHLWALLASNVEQGLAVCPFSIFRQTESELASYPTQKELYETFSRLYLGVSYRGFPEVLMSQVRIALADFLGYSDRAQSPRSWEVGFTSDPQAEVQSWESISMSGGDFSSWTRAVKDYHEIRGDDPPVGDFDFQKRFEAVHQVADIYLQPPIAWKNGQNDLFTLFMLEFMADLARAFDQYAESDRDGVTPIEFLSSSEMLTTPFIDIHSSIRAGMLTFTRNRTVHGNDLQDVLGIATVLPYSDVLTTDKYMKEIVTRTGLDKRFDVTVCSAAARDVNSLATLLGS